MILVSEHPHQIRQIESIHYLWYCALLTLSTNFIELRPFRDGNGSPPKSTGCERTSLFWREQQKRLRGWVLVEFKNILARVRRAKAGQADLEEAEVRAGGVDVAMTSNDNQRMDSFYRPQNKPRDLLEYSKRAYYSFFIRRSAIAPGVIEAIPA